MRCFITRVKYIKKIVSINPQSQLTDGSCTASSFNNFTVNPTR